MSQIYQGHGNHWGCLYAETTVAVKFLPTAVQEAKSVELVKDIEINGNEMQGIFNLAYLSYSLNDELDFCTQLIIDTDNNQNLVASFYPVIRNGAKINLKITEIQEWDNKIEAIITGEDQNGKTYRFFDCYYALNKDKYILNNSYSFALAGLISESEIVDNPTFSFKGQQAIDFLTKLGEDPKESTEKIEPITFDMSQLKAFFQTNDEIPQSAEFQSPINKIDTLKIENSELYRLEIYLYEDEICIPAYCKLDSINKVPKIQEPLRGILYLQGYCID